MKKIQASSLDMDKCTEQVGNRFNLVLLASLRAKELRKGFRPLIDIKNSAPVVALKEIEEGLVTAEYLKRIK